MRLDWIYRLNPNPPSFIARIKYAIKAICYLLSPRFRVEIRGIYKMIVDLRAAQAAALADLEVVKTAVQALLDAPKPTDPEAVTQADLDAAVALAAKVKEVKDLLVPPVVEAEPAPEVQ